MQAENNLPESASLWSDVATLPDLATAPSAGLLRPTGALRSARGGAGGRRREPVARPENKEDRHLDITKQFPVYS
jgi:hypothetical protein